jgi:hypothetical protein
MQVVKGPVTKYLPLDCSRLGFSWAADNKVGKTKVPLPTNSCCKLWNVSLGDQCHRRYFMCATLRDGLQLIVVIP